MLQLLSFILGHLVSWSNCGDNVGSKEEVKATVHEPRDVDDYCGDHGQGKSASTFAVTKIAKGEVDEERHYQNLGFVSFHILDNGGHVVHTSESMATERK